MPRPDSCPDCGQSCTSHTGTYCEKCGADLFAPEPSIRTQTIERQVLAALKVIRGLQTLAGTASVERATSDQPEVEGLRYEALQVALTFARGRHAELVEQLAGRRQLDRGAPA